MWRRAESFHLDLQQCDKTDRIVPVCNLILERVAYHRGRCLVYSRLSVVLCNARGVHHSVLAERLFRFYANDMERIEECGKCANGTDNRSVVRFIGLLFLVI